MSQLSLWKAGFPSHLQGEDSRKPSLEEAPRLQSCQPLPARGPGAPVDCCVLCWASLRSQRMQDLRTLSWYFPFSTFLLSHWIWGLSPSPSFTNRNAWLMLQPPESRIDTNCPRYSLPSTGKGGSVQDSTMVVNTYSVVPRPLVQILVLPLARCEFWSKDLNSLCIFFIFLFFFSFFP